MQSAGRNRPAWKGATGARSGVSLLRAMQPDHTRAAESIESREHGLTAALAAPHPFPG